MSEHERESQPRIDDRPLEIPTVNPVGVVSYPATWSVSTGHHLRRRPLILAIAALFALMTVATGAVSLGAYCLTTDGGDGRALASYRPAEAAPAADARRAIVVELFTSQGCSSCPPADRLLRELAADPAMQGRVFPLAFHVDYWNYIGWQDPFSSAAWSDRQRDYAVALGADSVYTPQLVVDGRTHCVGSSEGLVRRQIREALARPAAADIDVGVEAASPDEILVSVAARRGSEAVETPLTAWVAVYEDGLETPVGRGENRGRHLENDRVVRLLAPATVLEAGSSRAAVELDLRLDAAWRRDRLGVVAFLQDPGSLAIHAAAATPLPATPARRSG